jgi:hypothetical protein
MHKMHQLRKARIDAAALQLSRLVHPFRGIKRLWTQLNRLATGLRQESQQQQQQQQRKWSWLGRGFGTFWNAKTAATTTTTRASGTIANFALANNYNKMSTLSFTRLSHGSCADAFELHRLSTTDFGDHLRP